MKKWCCVGIVLLLLLAHIPSLFASPQKEGSASTAASEPKTVHFAHLWGNPAEKAIMDDVLGRFMSQNPNIKVEQLVLASAYHTKLLEMLAGDTPPDVFLAYPGFNTFNLADRNVLLPLSEMWKKYGLDNYFSEGAKNSVSYKGEQWNIPWATHANIVIYGSKQFNQLGVKEPATLQEFEQICEKAKATKIPPLASGWKSLYRAAYPIELLLPSVGGGDLYSRLAALQDDWNNPTVREVLAIWKRWVEKGYWYPDPRSREWPEGLGLVAQNLAVMDFIGTYGTSVIENVGMAYGKDYDLFTFPQINTTMKKTLTGPYDALSIARKAPSAAAAQQLLAFMAADEAQSVRAKAGGLVLNKNVTSYPPPMLKVRKAIEEGASFRPGFFEASPPIGVTQLNHGAMVDFYDKPDPDEFIRRANETRAQFLKESKQ